MAERVGFEIPVLVWRASAFAEANHEENRTAELGNGERRGPQLILGPEPAVSGSDVPELNGQNPAESQEFLGLYLDARGKSLQPAD